LEFTHFFFFAFNILNFFINMFINNTNSKVIIYARLIKVKGGLVSFFYSLFIVIISGNSIVNSVIVILNFL